MSTVTVDRVALIAKLLKKNDQAKVLTRRGFVGTRSEAYKKLHAEINGLITQIVGY